MARMSDLIYAVNEMKSRNCGIRAGEVNTAMWNEICVWFGVPPEKLKEINRLVFYGIVLRKNDAVPDGAIWPLESAV